MTKPYSHQPTVYLLGSAKHRRVGEAAACLGLDGFSVELESFLKFASAGHNSGKIVTLWNERKRCLVAPLPMTLAETLVLGRWLGINPGYHTSDAVIYSPPEDGHGVMIARLKAALPALRIARSPAHLVNEVRLAIGEQRE